MKIALITFQDNGIYHSTGIQNEDEQLLTFLANKGLKIEKEIWNDSKVDWELYEFAILKSPWDYFNLIEDFYNWLTVLESKNVKLLNPIHIVKWNADKHYLLDIKKIGLKVTPSIFVEQGTKTNLSTYFEQFKTEKLIVKPAISGGSKNTFKITAANVNEVNLTLNELVKNEDFIVQPFLSEIEEHGEWSFLFFGGEFSHALLKKAKTGDFRVQAMYGGTVHSQNPPANLLKSASQYIDQFAKGCLYARVDGVILNNEFVLMELELIEPFLFLDTDPKSYERYFKALQTLIKQ